MSLNFLFLKQLIFLFLILSPLFYIVYRIRGKKLLDLLIYVFLILLYIFVYRRFVFGGQFVFHDTLWCHQAFYTIIDHWLRHGFSIGWNPFLNGGEPLYIYNNFFLWAEFVGMSLLNRLFNIPVQELINLYFTYILISYFTFSFVLFSILFKKRSFVFYPAVILIFSGITKSTFGQYMLSPLYLFPLSFMAMYLFLKNREKIYLCWVFFFLCVSSNHYLVHYLALFLFVFCCFWYLISFFKSRRVEPKEDKFQDGARPENARFPPRSYLLVAVLSLLVLSPFIYLAGELRGYVSPTRGNASLSERRQGFQPTVNASLKSYRFLFLIPQIDPYVSSGANLEYNHSVYYLGAIAVIFLFLSFFGKGTVFLQSCVYSLLFFFLLSSEYGIWLWDFFRLKVPLFFVRHSYVFSQIVCFLIIILSTYGFAAFVKNETKRRWIICLALCASFYVISKTSVHDNERPFEMRSLEYPRQRSFYASLSSSVPFDLAPIIIQEASATHPSDNFIFFRKKAYYQLLLENPRFTAGDLFLFDGLASAIERPKGAAGGSDHSLQSLAVEYLADTDPNHLRIRVKVPEEGYLIRRENFHHGWKARVNGAKVPIVAFENVFQAIRVPKGNHVVEFNFLTLYPLLFWLHVVFTFVGYVFFFFCLFRTVSTSESLQASD